METDAAGDSETVSLGRSELMNILRKGTGALSTDDGMDLDSFRNASLSQILEASKSREDARMAKMKKDLHGDEVDRKLLLDAEEEERRLLAGVTRVSSRLFEGKIVNANQKSMIMEWKALQKRPVTDRTVQMGGMTFILDTPPAVKVCIVFFWRSP
jgi:SWI/SNF-related matrix-associated actin-dependent regulator of chromatin subfamily A member 5